MSQCPYVNEEESGPINGCYCNRIGDFVDRSFRVNYCNGVVSCQYCPHNGGDDRLRKPRETVSSNTSYAEEQSSYSQSSSNHSSSGSSGSSSSSGTQQSNETYYSSGSSGGPILDWAGWMGGVFSLPGLGIGLLFLAGCFLMYLIPTVYLDPSWKWGWMYSLQDRLNEGAMSNLFNFSLMAAFFALAVATLVISSSISEYSFSSIIIPSFGFVLFIVCCFVHTGIIHTICASILNCLILLEFAAALLPFLLSLAGYYILINVVAVSDLLLYAAILGFGIVFGIILTLILWKLALKVI